MTQFYLKKIEDTIVGKQAPKIPAGFFATKKKEEEKETKKN